ncbi:hypothetical protein MTR_3g467700 [Medicago truncatula]|uniref:Uncharacterized protein n=1 Tax=Medicago truncatula TaxID=3880 RepID=A0A072UZG8_MEDTR|nr:hypothetical protein MTR_3g467700 [Medicago truncatula]
MSEEDAQDPVEVHVLYEFVKKRVKFFITLTDKFDELKAQLDGYFIHVGANQRTSDVVVNVSGVNLGIRKRTFGRPYIFHNLSKMIATLLTCLA